MKTDWMHKLRHRLDAVVVVSSLLIGLLFINAQIMGYHMTMAYGRRVLVPLESLDIQLLASAGEKLVLRYDMNVPETIRLADLPRTGTIVMQVSTQDVVRVKRVDQGEDLADNEVRMGYRLLGYDAALRMVPAAETFIVAQGKTDRLHGVVYIEFRLMDNGDSVVVGVVDQYGEYAHF